MDDAAARLHKILEELGRMLLGGVVELVSDSFYSDKTTRKELGLRVEERGRDKTLYTIFGNTELRNDIYENPAADTHNGEPRCIRPVLLGLGCSRIRRSHLQCSVSLLPVQ